MDRKRLSRIAYQNALDAALHIHDVADRRSKVARLSAAYQTRKSQIELSAFLLGRGLGFMLDRKAA